MLMGWGAVLGTVFSGLLGAVMFTSEVRHGTIRPTFAVTPRRGRVIGAKALASMAVGAAFGLLGTLLAVLAGRFALSVRGLPVATDTGNYVLLVLGSALSGALFGVVGLGLGAMVRGQVPAVVGLLAWTLFLEGQVVANIPAVGRLLPSAAAQAMSGLNADRLLSPVVAGAILALYGAAFAGGAVYATVRGEFG